MPARMLESAAMKSVQAAAISSDLRLSPSTTPGRRCDAPYLDRRWFVLFGAALLACAALGFYYTRHRHGAPAVPLLLIAPICLCAGCFGGLIASAPHRRPTVASSRLDHRGVLSLLIDLARAWFHRVRFRYA